MSYRVLFLAAGDITRASSRYRVYQYLPFFKQLIPKVVWSAREDRGIIEQARSADLVFIQKVLFSPAFLAALKETGCSLVYDFDDTVFLEEDYTTQINTQSTFFQLFQSNLKYFDLILAGNQYLYDVALRYHHNVRVIPTTVDVLKYQVKKTYTKAHLVIGWIGHSSNLSYLRLLEEPLRRLKSHQKNWVFRVISDRPWTVSGLPIEFRKWNLLYLQELQQLDIGVMPLFHDDIWAKGKCACKALQYMAVGIPAVLSPVGMNRNLIKDGITGFLGASSREWFDKLLRLLNCPDLRRRIGQAGRKHVEAHFAAHPWAHHLEELIITEIANKNRVIPSD